MTDHLSEMTDHLSEAAIQQYALNEENCPVWMGEHVKACERCSVQVSNYRLIFKEVAAMEVPMVDIAGLVLAGLDDRTDIAGTGRVAGRKKDWSLGYWLAGAGLTMLVAGWFLRAFLSNVTENIPSLILYVLVGVSVGIAIVRGGGMIVQYRHQIKNLNLS